MRSLLSSRKTLIALLAKRTEMDDNFQLGEAGAAKNVSFPFECRGTEYGSKAT